LTSRPDSTEMGGEMSMDPEPTLILGLAAGLHYGDVRPFAVSLRRSGFQGRCVLFVSPTTRGIELIGAQGIRTTGFERPPELAHLPYNAYRYFLYLDFLRNSAERFERILLTDVRDVVFQGDPFAYPWPKGLSVGIEDRGMRIGGCEHMVRWLAGHPLGTDGSELYDQPISCSGITVGDHIAMVRYLEDLTGLLLPFNPGPRMAGYDQGVHNRLLHSGRLDPVTRHDNSGPILTLGYKQEVPPLDENGDILNDAGQPAHIVHQYDRMEGLFRSMRERFA
jgi:hypothetical protein